MMNFNKIAPFGKEGTANALQDHAAQTQDTLVDAVENAEVAEIKRTVFRALPRLRTATMKEFDTIARLETQAIDAYNDAHQYRAENHHENWSRSVESLIDSWHTTTTISLQRQMHTSLSLVASSRCSRSLRMSSKQSVGSARGRK